MRFPSFVAALALLPALVGPLAAQEGGVRAELRHVVSVQPAWALLDIYSGEYELRLPRVGSLAVGATWLSREFYDRWQEGYGTDDRSLSLDLKLRLRGDNPGLRGLALVLQVGAYREATWIPVAATPPVVIDQRRGWRTSPTGAIGFDHLWLDPRSGRLAVRFGAGYKYVARDWGASALERQWGERSFHHPTVHAAVGVAF